MYTVATERLRKQDLLLVSVKCGGVNPQSFVKYIQELKGDNFDFIDAWDINELQNAIEGYQQSQQLQVVESQIQFQKQDENEQPLAPQSQFGVVHNGLKNGNMSFYKNMQEKFFRQTVQCNKAPSNQLVSFFEENKKQTLESKITDYKIIDEGIFLPNYIRFKIEIQEFGWCVWRRYKDFQWLRNVLMIQFPDNLIPPIPSKTFLRKFKDAHISKRITMFEMFFTTIINTPLLRTSQFVIEFLQQTDDAKFLAIQSGTANLQKPQTFEEYTSLEGSLVLEVNPFLNQYLTHTDDIYRKTTNSSKVLFNCLEEASQKMQGLEDNIKTLRQLTEHFNSQNIIGNLGILPFVIYFLKIIFFLKTYQLLEEYLKNWQKNMEDLTKTFKVSFYEFLRFQREMQIQCLELVKIRNRDESTFLKNQKDLDQKKEKYFTTQPLEKWELGGDYDKLSIASNKQMAFQHMFSKDQAIVTRQRDTYAYINKSLIENFTQYFDNKGVIYTQRFLNALQKKSVDLVQFNYSLEAINKLLSDVLQLRCGIVSNLIQQEWKDQFLPSLLISQVIGAA